MRSPFLSVLSLICLIGLVACGDNDPTTPSGTRLSGTYTLKSVDDVSIPGVVGDDDECDFFLHSGSLAFTNEADVRFRVSVTVNCPGTADDFSNESDSAMTYTYANGDVRIYDEFDEFVFEGQVVGNTMTLSDDIGTVLVFRK